MASRRQNLRDEVAMDVDEEEAGDSTQRLRSVPDYGLEIDFEMLSSGEREVGRISAHGFDKRRPFLT